MKLGEIAARLECRLDGPEELEIAGVAGMDEAGPGELTFLANPKYLRNLATTRAAAIIANPGEDLGGRPALRSENPTLLLPRPSSFSMLLTALPQAFTPRPSSPRTSNLGGKLPSGPTW